ncbi:hypothetical protein F5Y03DRAFT_397333 [Xylaria venustula]|nr:hypothetical protein F5Y03DRAFT_397333 [Xylaria venustula]
MRQATAANDAGVARILIAVVISVDDCLLDFNVVFWYFCFFARIRGNDWWVIILEHMGGGANGLESDTSMKRKGRERRGEFTLGVCPMITVSAGDKMGHGLVLARGIAIQMSAIELTMSIMHEPMRLILGAVDE